MKKLLILVLTFVLTAQISFSNEKEDVLKEALKYTKLQKGTISFSIKDVETGHIVGELNSDVQISPASTQKILTFLASEKTLGEDYKFSTKLYKTKNGDYYIKLGADPYLTSEDLNILISHVNIPKNDYLKNFYIDDTILDNNNWGEGWQWDDALNVLMPKFGAYNIDKNLYTIVVKPTKISAPANIFTEIFYPVIFINKTITSLNVNNIKISQEDNDISPDALTVSGEVDKTTKVKVPINYLRRYFILRLDDAFAANKISHSGKYERAKVPANAQLIASIDHSIKDAEIDVLKNSNNLVAETVYKLAGGKYAKNTGTAENAIAMFNNYCITNRIDCSNVRLTDGSGVSKNNLVSADFMTQYLLQTAKIYDYNKLSKLLPTSGEGTLSSRMPSLKDKIHAKTGTLSNISGITGYIDAQSGKTYAFAIYITDGKSSESSKKLFEEILLRNIYEKL